MGHPDHVTVRRGASGLTVLGSCGGWPEPGRACSGVLLEHRGTRVAVDLGFGTLGRLLDLLGSPVAKGLDAVVITHEHPDHMVDLHALLRARWFGARGAAPLPLHAPAGVLQRLRELADDPGAVDAVFTWSELPSCDSRALGALVLESRSLPHFVPNAGVRLVSDDLVVVVTGDTGPDPAVVDLARGADLLVCDATDRHQRPGVPAAGVGPALDLTAREAGAIAREAGVRRLLLTHFWPGNDRARSAAEAAEEYDGEVVVAVEGLRVDLP